ncbi:pilus assembly PilX family protein [Chitinimonas lacunae]|uniref:Pilus assembly protein PilX n=1 Tax=Chitinimonas lacunae TaxID=1963018 RepID=A0ABV8MR39_9NEIS
MKTASLRKQNGLILFIALVVLLLMSLAAVGLVKTMDAGTSVVGNLALKQTAVAAGDRGFEAALAWLEAQHKTNPALFNANQASLGYSAVRPNTPTGDAAWFKNDSTWSNAPVAHSLDASGNPVSSTADDLGNTVRYLIVRQCREAKAASPDHCLISVKPADGARDSSNCKKSNGADCSLDGGNEASLGKLATIRSVYYAIYVQVSGTRNTRTVLHSLVAQPL